MKNNDNNKNASDLVSFSNFVLPPVIPGSEVETNKRMENIEKVFCPLLMPFFVVQL